MLLSLIKSFFTESNNINIPQQKLHWLITNTMFIVILPKFPIACYAISLNEPPTFSLNSISNQTLAKLTKELINKNKVANI